MRRFTAVYAVDTDPPVGQPLLRALATQLNVDLKHASLGPESLSAALELRSDMVFIDWGARPADSLQLCGALRTTSPIVNLIVLAAASRTEEVVAAYDAGVDDWVFPGTNPDEFVARVMSHLRRSLETAPFEPLQAEPSFTVNCGPIEVNLLTQRVSVDGDIVELTAQQWRLFCVLLQHIGAAVSSDELRAATASLPDPSGNTLRKKMARLRERLGAGGHLIEAVRGRGYRLNRRAQVP